MKNFFHHLSLVLLCSCALPRLSTENIENIPKDKIVFIGSIETSRPLPKAVESLTRFAIVAQENMAILRLLYSPLPEIPSYFDRYKRTDIMVNFKEEFKVIYDRYDIVYLSGIFGVHYVYGQTSYLTFPIRGYIKTNPSKIYHYIGHIYISLDESYKVTGIKVLDRYQEIKTNAKPLQKSLLVLK